VEAEELLPHSLQSDTDKCSDPDESSPLSIAPFLYVVRIIFSPARVFDGLLLRACICWSSFPFKSSYQSVLRIIGAIHDC